MRARRGGAPGPPNAAASTPVPPSWQDIGELSLSIAGRRSMLVPRAETKGQRDPPAGHEACGSAATARASPPARDDTRRRDRRGTSAQHQGVDELGSSPSIRLLDMAATTSIHCRARRVTHCASGRETGTRNSADRSSTRSSTADRRADEPTRSRRSAARERARAARAPRGLSAPPGVGEDQAAAHGSSKRGTHRPGRSRAAVPAIRPPHPPRPTHTACSARDIGACHCRRTPAAPRGSPSSPVGASHRTAGGIAGRGPPGNVAW